MRNLPLVVLLSLSLAACVSGTGEGGGTFQGTSGGAVDGGTTDAGASSTSSGGSGSSTSSGASGSSTSSGGSGSSTSSGASGSSTSSGGSSTSSGGSSTSSSGSSSGSGSSTSSSGSGSSSGSSSSGSGSSSGVTGPAVDPKCLDGKYKEALPPNKANIDSFFTSYTPAGYMTFIEGVLKKRYPFGHTMVTKAPKHINNGKTCVDTFLPPSFRSSASMVMKRMGVLVHECGHFYDTMVQPKRLAVAEGLTLTCSSACGSDSKLPFCPKNGKETFPRSMITKDKWSAKHKPCPTLQSKGCDTYAYIYLNGDPTNGNFESGDQGFDLLMEEAVQYVNSLATGFAFKDKKGGFGSSSSDRDGILTFLWYMERYLHMARTKYPAVHKRILGDACWRQVILNTWGRAWLFLNATENMGLGIKDAKLKPFVLDPELLGEIQRVRKAHGC